MARFPAVKTVPHAQIRSAALTGISPFLFGCGLDPVKIFDTISIKPDSLLDPNSQVNLNRYCALWQAAEETANDGMIGLRFGRERGILDMGLIGYMSYNSATLCEAFKQIERIMPFHQDSTVAQMIDLGANQAFEYDILNSGIEDNRHDAEITLALALNLVRQFTGGEWRPEEVHFKNQKPVYWRKLEHHFGAPVYFSQPSNLLVFPKAILGNTNPSADPNLLKVVEPMVERQLKHVTGRTSLLDNVIHQVGKRISEPDLSVKMIGEDLGVGYRTLQRRLGEENKSFSDIIDDVRRKRAGTMLKETSVSITEISLMLGYSDASALNRAFRRWYGVTPRQYRMHEN